MVHRPSGLLFQAPVVVGYDHTVIHWGLGAKPFYSIPCPHGNPLLMAAKPHRHEHGKPDVPKGSMPPPPRGCSHQPPRYPLVNQSGVYTYTTNAAYGSAAWSRAHFSSGACHTMFGMATLLT